MAAAERAAGAEARKLEVQGEAGGAAVGAHLDAGLDAVEQGGAALGLGLLPAAEAGGLDDTDGDEDRAGDQQAGARRSA